MKAKEGKILVVDDDDHIRLSLRVLLEDIYAIVDCISKPDQLISSFQSTSYDIVLLDMNFAPGVTSGNEGLQWLKWIEGQSQDISVVVVTAYADVSVAVDAVKSGAVDFVVKPWSNEKMLASVNAAYKLAVSKKAYSTLNQQQKAVGRLSASPFDEIVGRSAEINKVFDTISKVAPTDANVLILGENGTGKELIARALHRLSARSSGLFVTVDAGAIPETLFESELFGHKKGAFTDAREDRTGRFEAANGGTLFLDEIGNIPLNLQSRLLSVVQNREVTKLGSNKPVNVDVRLICATNTDLNQAINQGSFRQDLLYRINTVEIKLPPLRERQDDIPLLITHFVKQFCRKYNRPVLKIPDHVVRKLQKYHWPGNVRELRHAIERVVILSEGEGLKSADFLFSEISKPPGFPLDDYNLDNLERWAIDECIKKHYGNISKAAKELGVTRGALYRRIEKHGL
jgi:DNA-binding NtrC family response regulator